MYTQYPLKSGSLTLCSIILIVFSLEISELSTEHSNNCLLDLKFEVCAQISTHLCSLCPSSSMSSTEYLWF